MRRKKSLHSLSLLSRFGSFKKSFNSHVSLLLGFRPSRRWNFRSLKRFGRLFACVSPCVCGKMAQGLVGFLPDRCVRCLNNNSTRFHYRFKFFSQNHRYYQHQHCRHQKQPFSQSVSQSISQLLTSHPQSYQFYSFFTRPHLMSLVFSCDQVKKRHSQPKSLFFRSEIMKEIIC